MVPARRLEGLVEQAVQAHVDRCHYHNMAGDSLSLFVDHECGRRMIPTVTTQVGGGERERVEVSECRRVWRTG